MKTTNYILTQSLLMTALLTGNVYAEENHQEEHSHQEEHQHNHAEHEIEQTHDEHDEESDDHAQHEDHGEEDEHAEHNEESVVELSQQHQKVAEIKVSVVKAQLDLTKTLYAPGELVNNLYDTSVVVALSEARVISRHVVLGQEVKQGEPLATLFSEKMSNAQSALKIAAQEWKRVKKLGKKVVGTKRYTNARVTYEQNHAEVFSLGMTEEAVAKITNGKWNSPLGQYTVTAPHAGTVLADDFQQGELLATGAVLLKLVNEDELWVEARLAPQIGQHIPVGTIATVKIGGERFSAKLVQENHVIEENTRTRKIRLTINNKDHLLHAGMFVDVYLPLAISEPVILLPESALMRSADGDWVVFIEEESGKFEQKEVELIGSVNGQQQIQGLHEGERVVTEGAFFVSSQLAKGGFDPHNH